MNCHGRKARFAFRIGRVRWWVCDEGPHHLRKSDGCHVVGKVKRRKIDMSVEVVE